MYILILRFFKYRMNILYCVYCSVIHARDTLKVLDYMPHCKKQELLQYNGPLRIQMKNIVYLENIDQQA